MTASIARREILGYYITPVAWMLLAGAQFIIAWLLFHQLEVYQRIQPQLTAAGSSLGIHALVILPTYSSVSLMLIVLTPLMGMRSFADEIASGRMRLLLSSPVSATQLVLGKWLGLIGAMLPLPLLMLAMALLLGWNSELDAGSLFTAALGLGLLLALSAAVSVCTSSLTSQPAVAALLAHALLILLWIIDDSGGDSDFHGIALTPHLDALFQGLVQLSSLSYFLSLTLLALSLCILRIGNYRGQS